MELLEGEDLSRVKRKIGKDWEDFDHLVVGWLNSLQMKWMVKSTLRTVKRVSKEGRKWKWQGIWFAWWPDKEEEEEKRRRKKKKKLSPKKNKEAGGTRKNEDWIHAHRKRCECQVLRLSWGDVRPNQWTWFVNCKPLINSYTLGIPRKLIGSVNSDTPYLLWQCEGICNFSFTLCK